MLKHYLTTALRHFRRHKVTTAINVACLALGLTCFMLAWGVTAYFGQQDRHHAKASRIYLITNQMTEPKVTMPSTPWLLGQHMRAELPQLTSVARVLPPNETALVVDSESRNASVGYADPEFLRIFDLPFVQGDREHALDAPRSAIVTRSLAIKLYGTENVIGRTLRFAGRDELVTITGVVGAIRSPSHLSTNGPSPVGVYLEVLMSMDVGESMLRAGNPADASKLLDRWVSNYFFTYAVLPEDGSLTAESLNRQLEAIKQRHVATEQERARHFQARPISDFMTIGLDAVTGADRTGISSTLLITMLGGMVLVVACLNYANLAAAQSMTRSKEVALRKVVGADRRQVIVEYMMEGALLTGAALVLSLGLLALLSLRSGPDTLIMFAAMPKLWLVVVALLAVVTILASSYPAIIMSRVTPAQALRNARSKGVSRVASTLLIGLQFGSASFLMISVFVMSAQNSAIKRAVWDKASDPLVVIGSDQRGTSVASPLLKSELRRIDGVRMVSGIQRLPWSIGGSADNLSSSSEPGAAQVLANQFVVADNFFETLQLPMLAGRDFSQDRAADIADLAAWQRTDAAGAAEFNVIASESLAIRMGFSTPADAINQVIYHPMGTAPAQRLRIIGVAGESTLRPLNFGINGSFYLFNPTLAAVPLIRISKNNMAATLAAIDATWHKLQPEVPITRRFADEQFEQAFSFLNAISGAFAMLAGFASLIAVMGLIGMALHVIGRRTHEIGVRKTLGATAPQILVMLLRGFSKPIVIANLAAWPLAYVVMRAYLSMFAKSTGLSVYPFLATLAITLVIAWLSVVIQAGRASRFSPATVLRSE